MDALNEVNDGGARRRRGTSHRTQHTESRIINRSQSRWMRFTQAIADQTSHQVLTQHVKIFVVHLKTLSNIHFETQISFFEVLKTDMNAGKRVYKLYKY